MFQRHLARTAAFAFVLLLTASAKDPKDQGFSGKWVMDKKDSHASEMLGDLRQNIKQKDNSITIDSVFPEPPNAIAPLLYLGVMTSSITLTTNGEESTTQVGPYAFASKTTVEGNSMTTEWHSQINGDPVQGKWVRTLSDDGKHMTLQINESSTKGQQGDATIVFHRK